MRSAVLSPSINTTPTFFPLKTATLSTPTTSTAANIWDSGASMSEDQRLLDQISLVAGKSSILLIA